MSTKFILDYVSNDDELVSLIDQEELCSIITSGVPNLVSFLEKTVKKIEENVPNTGQMIGNYTQYLKKDADYEPNKELVDYFCAKVPKQKKKSPSDSLEEKIIEIEENFT